MPVTDLHALRARRGRGQAREVTLSDRVTVRVRITDLDTLIALGRIPNPLVPAALELRKREPGELLTAADVTQRMEMLDSVCAALVVAPPWAGLDEVSAADGYAPEGKLCIADLYPAEVSALWTLAYYGLEFWESFRAEQQRLAALAASDGVGPAAVEPAESPGPGAAAAAPAADRRDAGSGALPAGVAAGSSAADAPAARAPADLGDSDGGASLQDADGPGLRSDRADLIVFPTTLGYDPAAAS